MNTVRTVKAPGRPWVISASVLAILAAATFMYDVLPMMLVG